MIQIVFLIFRPIQGITASYTLNQQCTRFGLRVVFIAVLKCVVQSFLKKVRGLANQVFLLFGVGFLKKLVAQLFLYRFNAAFNLIALVYDLQRPDTAMNR